jgi:hypothetical protein
MAIARMGGGVVQLQNLRAEMFWRKLSWPGQVTDADGGHISSLLLFAPSRRSVWQMDGRVSRTREASHFECEAIDDELRER